MKQKLFTLLTLLCFAVSGAWATPTIWNLQKTYSSASETALAADGTNWKYSGDGSNGVYTYQSKLSKAFLPAEDGTEFALTAGLKFTVGTAKKLQLGKGYLAFTVAPTIFIPTTKDEYVNLVIGNGANNNKKLTITGADKAEVTLAAKNKAYIVKLKASGDEISVTTNDTKLYLWRVEKYSESEAIAAPTPNLVEGSYYKGASVSLTAGDGITILCKQDAATKAYGLTDLSSYSSALSLSSSGDRKVWACAEKDGLHSEIVEYAYTRVDVFPTPVATPGAGTYNTTQNVELSAEGLLPNGVIRYTTNGNTPNSSSTEYTTPIEVSATTTIKAYVFDASGANKGSMLTAAYTIVELTDPSFSLSATSIPSNSSAQIKVGSNAGLDGVTLSNISYGTDGIVTVNASTGVVTPVAVGTTTITFDTEETAKYNASTGNELTITVVSPKCAKPTVSVSDFNFGSKKYVISVTNNEDGSTLKVSTDGGSSWSDAAVSYDVTSTATYNFKSVKDSYDDSDVATASITHDSSKKNIAWVYTKGYGVTSYAFTTDPMIIALQENYNVVEVDGGTSAPNNDWKNADLIVCSEAMQGNNSLSNGMVGLLDGTTPMIGLKMFNYGGSSDATQRWAWGLPANPSETVYGFTPKSNLYKLLNGIVYENDGTIKLSTGRYNSESQKNVVQTANFTGGSKPADNVIMGNIDDTDTKAVMHYSATKKYFGLGLSCDCWSYYTPNAITLVKNAAAMLMAGEDLTTEVASVSATVGANGYTTFACSYDLDLTDENRPDGLKAYKASRTGSTLTFTALNQTVPAGTGLLLLGETKGGDYDIPVVASGDAVSGNALVGVTTPTAKQSDPSGNYYFVMKKATNAEDPLAFAPLSTSSAVTIPAGKAYVEVPFGDLSAQGLSVNFEDESGDVTGITSVAKPQTTNNASFYDLQGRRVAQPTKGLYIVNGKKVIVK